MKSVKVKVPARMPIPQPCATIMVFDDGSSFEYLADIEIPRIEFHTCRTFEDIDHYLTGVRRGDIPPPVIIGIDVYCDIHPDFGMFEVGVELDPNICGFQLYEFVVRPASKEFAASDVVFFTSFTGKVGDLSTQRLKSKFGGRIENCARIEFREKLLTFAVDRDLIDAGAAKGFKRVGLTQEEYWSIFGVIAEQLRFTDGETCSFFGIFSGQLKDAESLVRLSTVANERIDELLSISVLLDRLLNTGDKRQFLEALEPIGDSRRSFDMLLTGTIKDLLSIRNELEFRIGGPIL